MEEFVNLVKQMVPTESWIYIVAILVLLIILIILVLSMRKRKAKKLLDETEEFYNNLKAVPLAFKLNKAEALARVNKQMQETVGDAQKKFDEISEEMKECALKLAKCDDMIYSHKVKQGVKGLKDLRVQLEALSVRVNEVNRVLNELLEQENMQRVEINKLKDKFRTLRSKIAANRNSYASTIEYIEKEVVKIETMFSTFEDLMFAADFTKAWEQQKDIKGKMQALDYLCDQLPSLYEHAR